MSERDKRSVDPDGIAGTPYADDSERAESEWLLARESDPRAPAPSPKIASDYAELEDLLGNPPLVSTDESWHDEVLKALSSQELPPSRPRRARFRRTVMGAALVAVSVAAVALLLLRSRAGGDELTLTIRHADKMRNDSDTVVVGDHLVVRARPPLIGDLRVYRSDGALVARCPHGPSCTVMTDGEQVIEVTLDAPVQYQVVLVVDMADTLPSGSMAAYIDAARAANAHVFVREPIDVH